MNSDSLPVEGASGAALPDPYGGSGRNLRAAIGHRAWASVLNAYLFDRKGSITIDRDQFAEALRLCAQVDQYEQQLAVWRLCSPSRQISRAIVHIEDEVSDLRERLARLVG